MSDCVDRLYFGGLLVHGPGSEMQDGGFGYRISRDGLDFGSPEAVVNVVESLSGAGDVERVERHLNVTSPVLVQVQSSTQVGLARGIAALELEFPRNGESVPLTWRPGDGSPAVVRDVVRVDMEPVRGSHLEEHVLGIRTFRLQIRHKPFVRAEFPVVIPDAGASGVRDVFREVVFGGTRRSAVSVRLGARDGVTALGSAVLWTAGCTGWMPRLTGFAVSDGAVSGGWWEFAADDNFRVERPASVVPGGSYLLVANLRSATAQTVSVTAGVFAYPSGLHDEEESQVWMRKSARSKSRVVSFEAWRPRIVPLAVLELPPADVGDGVVGIRFECEAAGVDLSEVWAFPICDTSSLVIVDRIPVPFLWANSEEGGRVRISDVDDESTGWSPLGETASCDELSVSPGPGTLYGWSSNTDSVELSGSMFERFGSHVVGVT